MEEESRQLLREFFAGLRAASGPKGEGARGVTPLPCTKTAGRSHSGQPAVSAAKVSPL